MDTRVWRSTLRKLGTLFVLSASMLSGCLQTTQTREDYEAELELRRQNQMTERQNRELEDIRRQKRYDDIYLRRY